MTKQQLKQAIEKTAQDTDLSVLEVITMSQAGAAQKGDEKTLDMLCEIKWDYI